MSEQAVNAIVSSAMPCSSGVPAVRARVRHVVAVEPHDRHGRWAAADEVIGRCFPIQHLGMADADVEGDAMEWRDNVDVQGSGKSRLEWSDGRRCCGGC